MLHEATFSTFALFFLTFLSVLLRVSRLQATGYRLPLQATAYRHLPVFTYTATRLVSVCASMPCKQKFIRFTFCVVSTVPVSSRVPSSLVFIYTTTRVLSMYAAGKKGRKVFVKHEMQAGKHERVTDVHTGRGTQPLLWKLKHASRLVHSPHARLTSNAATACILFHCLGTALHCYCLHCTSLGSNAYEQSVRTFELCHNHRPPASMTAGSALLSRCTATSNGRGWMMCTVTLDEVEVRAITSAPRVTRRPRCRLF